MNETARDRAQTFILFCDGLEEAGLDTYARRGRAVARDLLEALDTIEVERAGLRTLKARCDRQQAILGAHADQALREALRRA